GHRLQRASANVDVIERAAGEQGNLQRVEVSARCRRALEHRRERAGRRRSVVRPYQNLIWKSLDLERELGRGADSDDAWQLLDPADRLAIKASRVRWTPVRRTRQKRPERECVRRIESRLHS